MEQEFQITPFKITKAQQIKDIITPIPADTFVTNQFIQYNYDEEKGGPIVAGHCFLGKIHVHFDPENPFGDYDGFGARHLTQRFLEEKHNLKYTSGVDVNNDLTVNGYTEPEIKDRVMHLVDDMIAAGY